MPMILFLIYISAPIVMIMSDTATKLDVIITLLLPPIADWAYVLFVLLGD